MIIYIVCQFWIVLIWERNKLVNFNRTAKTPQNDCMLIRTSFGQKPNKHCHNIVHFIVRIKLLIWTVMSLILFKTIDRLYWTLSTTERYNIWYKQCYRIKSTQQNCKITVCVFPLLVMERKILHRTFQYNQYSNSVSLLYFALWMQRHRNDSK